MLRASSYIEEMFERLTENISKIFKSITGKGKLSVKRIDKFLREIQVTLLESDVNYKVVKTFIASDIPSTLK